MNGNMWFGIFLFMSVAIFATASVIAYFKPRTYGGDLDHGPFGWAALIWLLSSCLLLGLGSFLAGLEERQHIEDTKPIQVERTK